MNETEQREIRETVEHARSLTADRLTWKPYFPNNMLQNGQEGWYCVLQKGDHARKYTITFQYPLDEEGLSRPDWGIDRYILFEKLYFDLKGPLTYPEPHEDDSWEMLTAADDLNDFGGFVYAHRTLEDAKKRALRQWQAVFGYALSHLIEDGEAEELP